MKTLIDARQILYRGILSELFPYVSGQTLDVLLQSIDADCTAPLRVDATSTPSLVVNVGPAIVPNPESNRQKSIPFINNLIPTFTSGSVTFPSTNGGTITASPGTTYTLNLPTGNYSKVLLSLNQTGNIIVTQGTPNASSSAALVPAPPTNSLPFAYILLFNNAGVVQNIAQDTIFQIPSSNSGATLPITLPAQTSFLRIDSSGNLSSVALYDIVVGTGGDYATISAAVAAALPGQSIYILKGTYTENVVISSQLNIYGSGKGTVIVGSVTFATGSDDSIMKDFMANGITINAGVSEVQVLEFWNNAGYVFTDNGTGTFYQGMQE